MSYSIVPAYVLVRDVGVVSESKPISGLLPREDFDTCMWILFLLLPNIKSNYSTYIYIRFGGFSLRGSVTNKIWLTNNQKRYNYP
jgi:hypothetical protein